MGETDNQSDSDKSDNVVDKIIHISRSILGSSNSYETPRDDKSLSKDSLAEAIKVCTYLIKYLAVLQWAVPFNGGRGSPDGFNDYHFEVMSVPRGQGGAGPGGPGG